jgi:hypothetical protein
VGGYAQYSSFCHCHTECCTQNVPAVWISLVCLSRAKSWRGLKTVLMLYRFSIHLNLSENTWNIQRNKCVFWSHVARCLFFMWRAFLVSVNVSGIDIILEESSNKARFYALARDNQTKRRPTILFTVLHMHLAGATPVRPADHSITRHVSLET